MHRIPYRVTLGILKPFCAFFLFKHVVILRTMKKHSTHIFHWNIFHWNVLYICLRVFLHYTTCYLYVQTLALSMCLHSRLVTLLVMAGSYMSVTCSKDSVPKHYSIRRNLEHSQYHSDAVLAPTDCIATPNSVRDWSWLCVSWNNLRTPYFLAVAHLHAYTHTYIYTYIHTYIYIYHMCLFWYLLACVCGLPLSIRRREPPASMCFNAKNVGLFTSQRLQKCSAGHVSQLFLFLFFLY